MKNSWLTIGALLVVVLIAAAFIVSRKQQTQPTPSQTTSTPITQIAGYQGQLLAGSSSPYLDFTKNDYDKALKDNKIIFLDFYANWCPICRAETPVLKAGFDGLESDKIVGFRVNYNDNETDDNERALAKQFNVPYQHYKVIMGNVSN